MKKLLYFTAKWCGPCQMLAPKIEELSKTIPVEKFDVDENPELVFKYKINSVPTILVEVDGEEKERKIGASAPKYYEEMFNRY